jgi:hypothetical protein
MPGVTPAAIKSCPLLGTAKKSRRMRHAAELFLNGAAMTPPGYTGSRKRRGRVTEIPTCAVDVEPFFRRAPKRGEIYAMGDDAVT